MFGSSKCEVLSGINLKDSFHSLRLTEESKYCGIFLYFGNASNLYQRMPIDINISPAIWQSYINTILDCLHSRKYCEAILDDSLLFTPDMKSHETRLEDLQKALLRNALKISPMKCQSFMKELQYVDNTIFIKGNKVCVNP